MTEIDREAIAIPLPDEFELDKMRKLIETAYRSQKKKVAIHIPNHYRSEEDPPVSNTYQRPGTRKTFRTGAIAIKDDSRSYAELLKTAR